MESPPVYRFEGFELDTLRRRLNAPNGSACPLPSRAYDVLLYLVENRARVVGKDELMKAVWPRTVVEENNLNQAVSSARRALGDNRDNPRFILTVAGRGYQFVGELDTDLPQQRDADGQRTGLEGHAAEPAEHGWEAASAAVESTDPESPLEEAAGSTTTAAEESPDRAEEPASPTSAPGVDRRRILVALGASAAAIAAGVYGWRRNRTTGPDLPRSLAVLPFQPLTDEGGDPAIEIGVSDLLINRLSTLPDLSVAPLSSVLRFSRDRPENPVEAGRSLEVEAVLDGSLQIRDQRIRLTARLTDTRSGRTLWAGDFTERLDDFFSVQDSLASQLADALTPHLPADARRRALRRESTDVEAWQLYAQGSYLRANPSEASLREAIEFFSAAVARDPAFALALAGLSEAHSLTAAFDIEPPGRAFDLARDAAARSIAADPSLPDGHAAMGQVVTQKDRDLAAGRELYRRALRLDPRHAVSHVFMALSLCQGGQLPAAHDAIARAQQIEPASLRFSSVAGFIAYMSRQFDAAEDRLRSVLQVGPNGPLARHFLARVLLARGRPREALESLEPSPGPAPGWRSARGRALAQLGRHEEAAGELATLKQLASRGFGTGFDRALIHLELGDRDQALAALGQAVDDRSQVGGYVNVEPALDPLRDDPRFAAIAARMIRG
jgi:DNA-binding winged helix-turn-helix (wHTH) protein/TolB-like protein/cytochrome c-type biogenesis protein CcmH/NrfG